jgi:hypothetical protein
LFRKKLSAHRKDNLGENPTKAVRGTSRNFPTESRLMSESMVCPKLSAGVCEILKEPCEKSYEYKMGIKACSVLKEKKTTKKEREK